MISLDGGPTPKGVAVARRTALYRIFGAAGILLYIGIGYDPDRRLASHRRMKPWWADVATITVEWFESRESAESTELIAIRDEKPLYNVITGDENGCAVFLAHRLNLRRPRGRPRKPEGETPSRSIRVGDVWDDAKAAAEADGEKFAAFVERALRLELARRKRRQRRQAD